MKGITWLASYPKSGNTWFRAFLANLLAQRETPININSLGAIPTAGARVLFDDTTGLDSADLTFDEIDGLRPRVYEEIASLADKPIFLKIHDAYSYNSAGVPLVSSTATNGVIYFIRNPLDVAVSFAHHSACEVQEMIDCMGDINSGFCKSTRKQANQLRQILTSWSNHVLSWVDAPDVRVHVVRYEDMHAKPLETFLSAVRFAGLCYTEQQIETALRLCSFSELQRQENESGFREKNPKSQSFFRQGKRGTWHSVLTPRQVEQIVAAHGEVMQRFGYLTEVGLN